MRFFSLLLFLVFYVAVVHAQQESQPVDSLPAAHQSVPLADIPTEAQAMIRYLNNEVFPAIEQPVCYRIRDNLDTLKESIEELRVFGDLFSKGELPVQFMKTGIDRWERLRPTISGLEKDLKGYSNVLSGYDQELSATKKKWGLTKEMVKEEGPEEILSRLDAIIKKIDSTRVILDDSLSKSLQLQDELVDLNLTIEENIQLLGEQENRTIDNLMTDRKEPIWRMDPKTDSLATIFDSDVIWEYGKENTLNYLKRYSTLFYLILGIFLVLSLVMFWMRSRYRELEEKQVEELELGKYIFSRPLASAAMFTLIFQGWLLPNKPFLLMEVSQLVSIMVFVIVIPGLIERSLRWSIYFLSFVFLLESASSLVTGSEFIFRITSLIEGLAFVGFLVWFFLHQGDFPKGQRSKFLWVNFLRRVGPLFLLLAGVGVVADIIGYDFFARYINKNIYYSSVIWLFLGAAFRITEGLTYLFLQTNFAQGSRLVQQRREVIFQQFIKILRLATIGLWIYYTLEEFLLWEPLVAWGKDVLEIGYQFGDIEVTIGGIISFFLIVGLSWAISNAVKVLLEDEILDRMDLSRGVPMAIASLTNYTLFLIGFFLALAYAGFNLENIGLLAGALGVGIGFGLQNIVSNFISGLILVFERPITIGDIIIVEGIEGEVVNIGIRSSTIRQYNGDEEIIPNAMLVSSRVTNRTLSDRRRRFILTVNTEIEADPQEVLDILVDAAKNVDDVLAIPEPKAYFQGITDQSLQFSLYYWLSSNILDAKSQVNLNVNRSLREAGIKIPIPKFVEMVDNAGKSRKRRRPRN